MKKKRIVIFFLLFALIGSLFVPLTAGAVDLGAVSQAVRQKDVDANAALLVNMTEDTIYYEKNAQHGWAFRQTALPRTSRSERT